MDSSGFSWAMYVLWCDKLTKGWQEWVPRGSELAHLERAWGRERQILSFLSSRWARGQQSCLEVHASLVLLSPDAGSREEHAGLSLPSLVSGSALESFRDLRVKSRKIKWAWAGGRAGGKGHTDRPSEGNPRILLLACCQHPCSPNVQLQNSEL